ncbi:MAG: diacylglycerol kinase [Actinobacteria bacterium]|nr:diacylglycerol kinase [Actinomycetota bacterium]
MTYRVIQWSTGNVGKLALKGIIEHPDLELVGLVVHSEKKAGTDAGELAGLGPVGITATNDVDEALAMDADVVAYTATGDLRPHEAINDMCRILASGKNVVSTSCVALCYPPGAGEQDQVRRLEEACRAGGTSFFTSGIDPGFANDLLPLVLTGFCSRVDSVRVSEILNYDTYDQPEVLFETMGFGKPMDHAPLLLLPGVLTLAWGPIVHELAAGLGIEVERIDEWFERWEAPQRYETAVGPIEAGTMAGLHFELRGIVDGEPKIIIEHVTRMHNDAAPDWPKGNNPQGGYRVVVKGNPTYTMDLEIEGDDGDHNTGGLVGTAMRILNAIPAVVAAEPGLLSALDLPLVTGKHLMS